MQKVKLIELLTTNFITFIIIFNLSKFQFNPFSTRDFVFLSSNSESVQTYSFVLTSTDSKWRFGFCRHDAKAQTAMVIITYLPWHDTFLKFLNVLGEIKRIAKGDFQPFLAEAYAKGVPEPGACLKLFYNSGLNVNIFLYLDKLTIL